MADLCKILSNRREGSCLASDFVDDSLTCFYQIFDNTTGGMKNLPVVFFIPSIGIKILILVLFDRSIVISRAHARIHKVFYPCNRCHLATLLENQRVTCGNEVTRVTRNGVFALNIHSTQTQLLCLPNYCIWVAKPRASRVEGAASVGWRCRLRGPKVPPPRGEAMGFKVQLWASWMKTLSC